MDCGARDRLLVDFDGTMERDAVKKAIEEYLPVPLKGRALTVATNITFAVYDILDIGKQRVMDKTVPGMSLELNGPVLDVMYDCVERGIEVTVLTKNKKADHICTALKGRGICFKVEQTDDKAAYVREQQALNPGAKVFLLDDSIRDALQFMSRRVDGYVLYVNGHNGIAAKFLKPFVRTATDNTLKDMIRDSGIGQRGSPFAARVERLTA
jgi:hypothetical protein